MRVLNRWRRRRDALPGAQKRRDGEKGQALVEFALVMPLVLLILFAIIQFGIMLSEYITVTDAARDGARELALQQGNNDPCDPAVKIAISDGSSINLAATSVTITFATPTGASTKLDYCVGPAPSSTPPGWPTSSSTYPASNTSSNAGAEVEGDTATMTVQKVFKPEVLGFGFFSVTLSSSASDAIE
jgi:Flp pilus assembly protein TadG